MLNDTQSGLQATTNLSFMLEDMAKAYGSNKAMSMAFQFAQTGLSNLSHALKERSQEVQALQNEVDRLQSQDRLAEVDRMPKKLNLANAQITQLTHENNTLKGNNAQLLKQIEGLQDQAFDEQYCVDPQAIAPTPKQAKPEHKTLKR